MMRQRAAAQSVPCKTTHDSSKKYHLVKYIRVDNTRKACVPRKLRRSSFVPFSTLHLNTYDSCFPLLIITAARSTISPFQYSPGRQYKPGFLFVSDQVSGRMRTGDVVYQSPDLGCSGPAGWRTGTECCAAGSTWTGRQEPPGSVQSVLTCCPISRPAPPRPAPPRPAPAAGNGGAH